MTTSLLIATRNPGKAREIRAILRGFPHQLKLLSDTGILESREETQLEQAETFEGNARRKAEYFAKLSGGPTVAEDSGLEVLALGGEPGVRSRRFALWDGPADKQDDANNAELLKRLDGLPTERRRARYRCVVAFVPRPDAIAYTFEGACSGRILTAPEGTGGFGYDPLFYSDDLEMCFGVAPADEKDAVSHRGRAFRAFAEWLETRGR